MDVARVPEDFGRKLAFGSFRIYDIGVFAVFLIIFIALSLITAQWIIGVAGLLISAVIAFKKIDGLDFLQYMRLKLRKKEATLPELKMYFGNVLFNGKRYFAVLEVDGINYEFLSEEDRVGVLYKYEQMLNACDFPLQFVVKTEKINERPLINTVVRDDRTAEGYKNLIREFCSGLYIQRYFIVVDVDWFELPPIKDEGVRAKIARDVLEKRLRTVIAGLVNLGMGYRLLRGTELIQILKEETR